MARRSGRNGKPSEPVWVDTQAWFAMMSPRDQWHRDAVRIYRELHSGHRYIATSKWVMTVLLALTSKPPLRGIAIEAVQRVSTNDRYTVIDVHASDWNSGFDLYQSRPDKAWSLVDCISIVQCQRLKVCDVFSADRHFEQAGLVCLLPVNPA